MYLQVGHISAVVIVGGDCIGASIRSQSSFHHKLGAIIRIGDLQAIVRFHWLSIHCPCDCWWRLSGHGNVDIEGGAGANSHLLQSTSIDLRGNWRLRYMIG